MRASFLRSGGRSSRYDRCGPDAELTPAQALEEIFRREHGLVLSSLIRSFADFDVAEEALAEAVASAVESWPRSGTPANPAAWLLTVARRKGIDRLRRRRRLAERVSLLVDEEAVWPMEQIDASVADERLRLIFTCCHPSLSPEGRVALTLRTLGGLATAEIARAFLTSEAAMFQRIARAKNKIRLAGIPYQVPSFEQLPLRLESVLAVVYLIFNEGYSSMTGSELVRVDLCQEAIRLAEMLAELLPDNADILGLGALCWLTEARRPGRISSAGELVLLADQDRSSWNRVAIDRGLGLLGQVVESGSASPYVIQARIAALHSTSPSHRETDWAAIVELYAWLYQMKPSPVVALNHAAAVAMAEGATAGLALMEPLARHLAGYQPFHAARAELLARSGRHREAAETFRTALGFAINDVERRHLEKRLGETARS
jgi:RNA polymerase sigma-70 factor (ECF subfamily)